MKNKCLVVLGTMVIAGGLMAIAPIAKADDDIEFKIKQKEQKVIVLPANSETIVVEGKTYYRTGGVYYEQHPQGYYFVVPAPKIEVEVDD